jgi:glycerophosphoryl diester phosphodiesterase
MKSTTLQQLTLALTLSATALLASCGSDDDPAPAWATLDGKAPLVVGHRGASGTLPEHTLEAYKLAIEQGADMIEPDLVLTKDGEMIARHEPMLDSTTDVATKFPAARMATKMVDGVSTTAYFAGDFTLAEIKTLRAVQARAGRSKAFDGQYGIPTLAEVIALAKSAGTAANRTVGIYPEIKHSTFHIAPFGANTFEDKLVAALHAAYGNSASAPVFIQSFEVANLKYLRTKTNIKLVQLVDADDVNADGSMSLVAPYRQPYDFVVAGDARTYSDLLTDTGLAAIKTYADVVAPWKPYLLKTVDDKTERTGDTTMTINDRRVDGTTGVIERAHKLGLAVHTWTFRDDASGYGYKDPKAEMQAYMKLGLDGFFTDFPATGVAARAALP